MSVPSTTDLLSLPEPSLSLDLLELCAETTAVDRPHGRAGPDMGSLDLPSVDLGPPQPSFDRPEAESQVSAAPVALLADETPPERLPKSLAVPLPALFVDRSRPPRSRAIQLCGASADVFMLKGKRLPRPGTAVEVEVEMLGAYRAWLPGEVLRSSARGAVVGLELNPATAAARAALLLELHGSGLSRPRVKVRLQPAKPAEPPPVEDPVEAAWARVLDEPTDDERHQGFLSMSLRHGALDRAVARYRERKDGGDPLAERYLTQLGTLLAFSCAPAKSPVSPELSRVLRAAVVAGLAVVLSAAAGGALLRHGLERAAAAPASLDGR